MGTVDPLPEDEPESHSRLLDHEYGSTSRSSFRSPSHGSPLHTVSKQGNPRKRTTCCIPMTILLVVGAILAVIGGVMFPVVDHIIREQVKEKVVISNTSETYEIWQDVPVPIYMQFYLFDIVNPDEVMNGGTPYLNQTGPFTYREYRIKYDIEWHDNGTVTYRQNRTFYFVPEMSVAGDDMKITTINPLVATVAQNMHLLSGLEQAGITAALLVAGETIIMTRPVSEVLFGYDDPVLAFLHGISPEKYPTVNIGYFIRRNYTDDGLYTVYTGETDIDKLAYITEYNGADTLDLWTTPYANMVNGTDGTVGPPFRFDAQVSPVFVSDLCRSIRGVYKGRVKTPQGIELRRFGGDRRDMENATINPDNIGFCVPQTKCLPTGLLNSTLCQEPVNGLKLPVIFSFPHFLYADPEVQKSVEGLKPVVKEHDTVIDQEPWTGLVLQVAKRLQINMYVRKLSNLPQTRDIQTLFFPIVWLNESSVVNDHWANKLKDQLFTPMKIAFIGKIGLLVIGGVLVIVSITVLIVRRRAIAKDRNRNTEATSSPSAKDAAYDKPVENEDEGEEDSGRASVNSSHSPQEGGRNSADTLEGKWYDPKTYGDGDGDGTDTPYGSPHKDQDTPLLVA